MILYDADMKIPISNTLYRKNNTSQNIKNINIARLNNITFQEVDPKKFPSIKLIKKCFKLGPLASTIINASNEELISLFLKQKVSFLDIVKTINKIIKDKEFNKYARKKPTSIKDILIADKWARLKTLGLCVK